MGKLNYFKRFLFHAPLGPAACNCCKLLILNVTVGSSMLPLGP